VDADVTAVGDAAADTGGPAETTGPRTVRSVLHAITLLKAIAQNPTTPSSLSELAKSAGLSKPATFNLLKTLELEGLIRKDGEARYSLTWGMYELGSSVLHGVDVSRIARAHLDALALETSEAVLLAILDEDSVLYLDRGQSAETFAMVANVGRRSPLHSNASGKMLLAGEPDVYVERILSRPLEPRTPHTVTDPDVLRAQLAEARANDYAVCREEQEIGLSSISVPIRDYTGSSHGVITIAGPANRIAGTALDELLTPLRATAAAISKELGAR